MESSWQFLFISFTISFLLTLAVAQEEPLDYSCMETGGNFTINSTYETNLNRLISSFSANTANDYGFYNLSSGEGSSRVNSIALCRGDVGSGDCLGCINNATTELRSLCPDQREAIIWYDNCMFRYTNRSIFGVVEDDPLLYMWNDNNVTDVDAFNQSLSTLLDSLINSASSGTSLRKFATGSAQVTPFQTVYALVQCTPDLSQAECTSCLSAAIEFIPECCDRKQGGRVLEPSCNFRFEIERFYNLTTADTPLTSTPPPTTSPPSNNTKNTTGKKSNSSRTIIIASFSAVAFAVLVVCSCIFIFLRVRKSKVKGEKGGEAAEAVDEIKNAEALQYDFSTISAATNHFSNSNKLGQGGFGAVYKGKLAGGELIAVKRLSTDSGQGDLEFKNEVLLVAKLQHRNLVRLQGFCLERNERLLIYEFVPNASLDQFLFDPVKRAYLDWEKRYKIIGGIARGLLYLHEDSRLRIIHRDLKASNILLDAEMNPKIADFGMARLCAFDQTHGATSKIVGTYGYMAPEYAMHGQFSVKSDVFSFGVLVLEVLSGQKNSSFHKGDNVDDLLSYAWRNWKDGTANELVDSTLKDSSTTEVMRCLHIGLLCVQENVAERPNMASVALMLTSYSVTLPLPSQPAFFMHSNTQSEVEMLWSEDLNSGATKYSQSRKETAVVSENEVTITELHPR
ncbi:hypothetical protein ERO13_D06G125400v2 [Gossypium hirsutum]|uniref:Receptor-like protein kinase At4g00960 isoform X1 n=1 Tax=Gossypium hirsutum TaxID=3635 RepID=A0ABM3AAE6_GOSHI|nr:putative receptor-like protein kinase At4g00960 isoform X1 [Gossypium hirsutum]KAG4142370.1 hypothetical protein ERO13_D06G125400v2 [Gossypium hirsutum]